MTRLKRIPCSLVVCAGVGVATPEIERRFFAKLRLPNGTWKTTYPNRLDDLNKRVRAFLPDRRCLEIMDVAISSGGSTVEWSDHLLANGVNHRLVAGDIDTEAWLTSWGSWFAVLFDSSGREPLLLEVGPLMLSIRSDRWLVRLVRPILVPVLRSIAAGARRVAPRMSGASAVPRGLICRSVSLVSAELRRRPQIEIVQDDITAAGRFAQRFDVIRVANLVQRAYFDESSLRKVVSNLRERLRDGGILIICHTMEDGVNHATIFRRTGDQLVAEESINGGVEVSDLILAL